LVFFFFSFSICNSACYFVPPPKKKSFKSIFFSGGAPGRKPCLCLSLCHLLDCWCYYCLCDILGYTAELHLSGLIGTASHPDVQKIRIIGFFLENTLHWQFGHKFLRTNGYCKLYIYLRSNKSLYRRWPSTFTANEILGTPCLIWEPLRLLLSIVCTVSASKPFDQAWYEVLEAIKMYCTWSDNR
jgi:hypothetical protein